MKISLIKKCTFGKIIAVASISLIIWSEWLCYEWATIFWPVVARDETSVRLLLVADPQLIGLHDENVFHPAFRSLGIWDADRYLAKGYSKAFHFLKPNAVIFLGDLLDEGQIATYHEYEAYVQRFKKIFFTIPNVKPIYLWGDNDVGGEGGYVVTENNTKRFQAHFGDNSERWLTANVEHISFFKIDQNLTESLANLKRLKSKDHEGAFRFKYKILLSHMNLLYSPQKDSEPIIRETKANLVISAHGHEAKVIECINYRPNSTSQSWRFRASYISGKLGIIHRLDLNNRMQLRGIQVPACSYRMGVPHMGYGVAIIDKNGHMQYTVYWLPSRYMYLNCYVFILFCICLYVIKTGIQFCKLIDLR